MEIIDAGVMGVRCAVLRLIRRATPLRFTIYPMVHLGEAAYYTEVARRLAGHDLIVAEGIQGASRQTRNMTRAYRWAGGTERLGLVTQEHSLYEVGVPLVLPDMTGKDLGERWRKIPLWERVLAGCAAPVFGLYLRLFGTRALLARHLKLDDDIMIDGWNPKSGIEKLVGDDREALLVEALEEIARQRRDEPIDVAVVYGAHHAIPVVQYLAAQGYVVRTAEWVTVFDY
jgi:hypothetical protein